MEIILHNFHNFFLNMNVLYIVFTEKFFPYSNSYFVSNTYLEIFVKILGEIFFHSFVLFVMNEKMYTDFYSFFFDISSCVKLFLFILILLVFAIRGPFNINKEELRSSVSDEFVSADKNEKKNSINSKTKVKSEKEDLNKQTSSPTKTDIIKTVHFGFVKNVYISSIFKSLSHFNFIIRRDGFNLLRINTTMNYIIPMIVEKINGKSQEMNNDLYDINFTLKLIFLLVIITIFTNFNKFYLSVLDFIDNRNLIENIMVWMKLLFKSMINLSFYTIFYIDNYSIFKFYQFENYSDIEKVKNVCYFFSLMSLNVMIP